MDALYIVMAVTGTAHTLNLLPPAVTGLLTLWCGCLLQEPTSSLGQELGFAFPGQGEEAAGPALAQVWGQKLWQEPPSPRGSAFMQAPREE